MGGRIGERPIESGLSRPTAIERERPVAGDATAKQVRGSGLLFAGRIVALGIDFVAQVLIVRYLTKSDYGAFALAMSFITLGTSISLLGLERTIGRFAPIYQERGEIGRMWGVVAIIFATVLGIGVVLVAAAWAAPFLLEGLVHDELALSVLLIMALLAPLQALDTLLVAMFATFGSPRAIFVRRYVVAPLLQLGVVVAVIASAGGVRELAAGWVVASAIGVVAYAYFLVRLLARQGLFEQLRTDGLRLPFREVFGFSIPLLASDLVFLLRGAVTVILLERLRNTIEVADYRAVLPLAMQTLVVATSFRFLFTPGAARLYAREDHHELNHLYWQTAVWIAIITFPVLVATVALAEPVVVLLYGERYREAAIVLAVLAVGHYVHGSVGFNSLTLRVYGRVRFMVVADLIVAAIGLTATVILIEQLGALGAAIGTTASLLLQNALYQVGLARQTDVRAFDPDYLRPYLSIVVALVAVTAVQLLLSPPIAVGIVLGGLASLAVLLVNRDQLRLMHVFPELGRLPFARQLFGDDGRRA